jgi:hypothetical protein
MTIDDGQLDIDDLELIKAIGARIAAVERKMIDDMNEALYGGYAQPSPWTPEQEAAYQKQRRKERMARLALEPFRRIKGAWLTLMHGQCDRCEVDSDEY